MNGAPVGGRGERQADRLAARRESLVLSEAELLRVQYCKTILRPHAQMMNCFN